MAGWSPTAQAPQPPPPFVLSFLAARLDSADHWDAFYAAHESKFFKHRHWLGREFPELVGASAVLEVGCGAGDAALPLLRCERVGRVFATDFAPNAIGMLREAPEAVKGTLVPFVADAGAPPPAALIGPGRAPPGSADAATLIFLLSAMAPAGQAAAMRNVGAALRVGGVACVRDYAVGDLAATRLASRATPRSLDAGDDAAADGSVFLARGDGTRAFFFSEAALVRLFKGAGFSLVRVTTIVRTKTNRRTGAVMERRWVQGVFRWDGEAPAAPATPTPAPTTAAPRPYLPEWEERAGAASAGGAPDPGSGSDADGDAALGAAAALFAPAAAATETKTATLPPPLHDVAFQCAPADLRSTLADTGLLPWPAAPALAAALLTDKSGLLNGSSVLEVGAGGSPLVLLAALAAGARRAVASDGSPAAARLLAANFARHAHRVVAERGRVRVLEWGGIEEAASLSASLAGGGRGFDLALGADVLYSPPATSRLMATLAAALKPGGLAVLCHQTRRVGDAAAAAAAAAAGLTPCAPPAGLAAAAAAAGVGDDTLLRLVCFRKGRGRG